MFSLSATIHHPQRFGLVIAVALMAMHSSAEDLTQANVRPKAFAEITTLVNEAIKEGQTPGAVVVAANSKQVLFARAFGDRQVEPTREPMTLDTVFDLASITKPVATATSVMKLVDQGKISVDDPVAKYLPEFGVEGKEKILVSELLLHVGGLIPDNSIRDYQNGPEVAWEKICALSLRSEPGAKFSYTDVGFIVLGKLVEKVSGRGLDTFAKTEVFQPLGMTETGFNPPPQLCLRAAATESRYGKAMKGSVHDPRAFLLGGVAGHAGVFSTAADLLKYGRGMLALSKQAGSGVFSADTFQLMTRPRDVKSGTRTFGWDHRSPYSRNRGTGFSDSAFGHGGFTGTVLWIDPDKDLVFIFLSTRLHPDGKGSINALAGKIATIIATD